MTYRLGLIHGACAVVLTWALTVLTIDYGPALVTLVRGWL